MRSLRKTTRPVSDEIRVALKIPGRVPKRNIVLAYRNRLTHHIRPIVDYSIFFSGLQSRTAAQVRDAKGQLTGMRILIPSDPAIEFRFQDLHLAFIEYLDAVVAMLDKLSRIEILRR